MSFSRLVAAALVAGTALAAIPVAHAQAPAAAAAADYEVKGFRSAHFGMTPAQVRSAIGTDFPGAKISDSANIAQGTNALLADVAKLDPGPGPAKVTYIFGATSKKLVHINVVWALEGEPTAEQRAGIVTAAVQLTTYFQSLPNPPKASAGVTPTGPNSLLMFAAVDKKGGGVEVGVEGISYEASADGKASTAPAPKGPAVLRISYIANAANPDVLTLKPGSF